MKVENLTELMKINGHFQVTIPFKMRKTFKIERGGYLEAMLTEEGVLLKPLNLVPTLHKEKPSFEGMIVKDQLKSAAGAWKYLIDTEKLKDEVKKSRSQKSERKFLPN